MRRAIGNWSSPPWNSSTSPVVRQGSWHSRQALALFMCPSQSKAAGSSSLEVCGLLGQWGVRGMADLLPASEIAIDDLKQLRGQPNEFHSSSGGWCQGLYRRDGLYVGSNTELSSPSESGTSQEPLSLFVDVNLPWSTGTPHFQLLAPDMKPTFVLSFHFWFFDRERFPSLTILGTGIETLLA